MKSFIFFLVFFSLCNDGFSQKSEVVYKSKFKHNYALGYDYYVEDAVDTAKLFYMGTIKIITSNQDGLMTAARQLLKTKIKEELNGNAYKLKSFTKTDTTLHLFFDVYFAPDKQIEIIEQNRIKEKMVVFNNIKDTIQRELFVNDRLVSFHRSKHLVISANEELKLNLYDINKESFKEKPRKNKDASFYSIRLKEKTGSIVVFVPGPAGAATFIIAAAIAATANGLANKYLKPGFERFAKLDYNSGRILMEIYPQDKQISVN